MVQREQRGVCRRLSSANAAQQGGRVAGTARKEIEAQTGESVISSKNATHLRLGSKKKKLHEERRNSS